MTEEIIIDECFNCKKKKDIGDNWRTCKLKCSYKYKRKENDYITRLEQENRELKAYKDINEDFKKAWYELNKKYKQLRSLLEEIREILIICKEFRTCERCKFYKECNKDLEGCITDKINEVLTP